MFSFVCCFIFLDCFLLFLYDIFSESSESSESSSSSDSEEGEGEGEEGGVRVVGWTPSGAQRALGEWEKHTTVGLHAAL